MTQNAEKILAEAMIGIVFRGEDDTHWSLFYGIMGGYVCPVAEVAEDLPLYEDDEYNGRIPR